MLPSLIRIRNPFKIEEEDSKDSSVVVGLKILVQISQGNSNIVVKSALTKVLPGCCSEPTEISCFLKSCYLCKKKLSFQKDVYMYRGDQGYCSIQCRDRQIYLDETKGLENSTKKMLSSYGHYCSSEDRRETQILLKELRRKHYKKQQPHSQKVNWLIVS